MQVRDRRGAARTLPGAIGNWLAALARAEAAEAHEAGLAELEAAETAAAKELKAAETALADHEYTRLSKAADAAREKLDAAREKSAAARFSNQARPPDQYQMAELRREAERAGWTPDWPDSPGNPGRAEAETAADTEAETAADTEASPGRERDG